MKIYRTITSSFVLLILGVVLTNAQQTAFDNQYLLNKYMLSPAYAGHNNNFEVFAGYRNSWLGVSGAPETKFLNVNGNVYNNSGVGMNLQLDQAGVFRTLSTQASYSHYLAISSEHSFRIGASAGLFESRVDLSGYRNPDQNDPVITDNVAMSGTVFDAGVGVAYQFRNLSAGVAVERLIESEVADKNAFYKLARHYKFHVGYTYFIRKDLSLEPLAVVRKTAQSDINFDGAAIVRYQKRYWAGLLYRHQYSAGMQIGGVFFDRVAVGYSYEFPIGNIAAQSSGTHELSIGVVIGEQDNTSTSVFSSTPKKSSYYKWVE